MRLSVFKAKPLLSFVVFSATLVSSYASAEADTSEHIVLTEKSHICNDESEIKRLAENEHLQEMAKALVEFKATKYCFILEPSVAVPVLEKNASYIKFSHNSQILYTFLKYITPAS